MADSMNKMANNDISCIKRWRFFLLLLLLLPLCSLIHLHNTRKNSTFVSVWEKVSEKNRIRHILSLVFSNTQKGSISRWNVVLPRYLNSIQSKSKENRIKIHHSNRANQSFICNLVCGGLSNDLDVQNVISHTMNPLEYDIELSIIWRWACRLNHISLTHTHTHHNSKSNYNHLHFHYSESKLIYLSVCV